VSDLKPWGLLFKDAMALAARDGRKTCTRRVGDRWGKCGVGRVLWVREVWALLHPDDRRVVCGAGLFMQGWAIPAYRADGVALPRLFNGRPAPWRSSLIMPRWASRTTLRSVSITREEWTPDTRLSEDEARAEGFASADEFHALWDAMHPGFSGTVWRIGFERVLP